MGEEERDNRISAEEEPNKMPAVQEGRYRTLKNGAVYDMEDKRIVAGQPLDSGQGRALAAKRQEKAAKAVRWAIAEGDETAHANALKSVYGGVKTISRAQMLLATTPDAGRASTEAAKWLLRAGQLAQDEAQGQQAPAVRLELGAAAVEALGRLLARRQQVLDAPGD